MESQQMHQPKPPRQSFAPFFPLLTLLSCVVIGFGSFQGTPIFRDLYKGLGVDLPLPTKFLLANYAWLYPLFFGGAAILLIVDEFVVREARRRLTATKIIFLASVSSLAVVMFILYLPLFDLILKLNRAK
jgi:type II secretory pathway component PulF